MPRTSPHSIVAALRTYTSEEHARLEHADFIMPSTRVLAQYGVLIGAMLSFHRAIEEQFTAHCEELARGGLSVAHRYRCSSLEEETAHVPAAHVPEPALHYATAAHIAGAIYVMEGSTLGGLVIARSVAEHLGVRSAYYGEFGAETATRWRETVAQLERYGATADLEAMRAGARYTFGALHAHLAAAFGKRCL